MANSTVLPREDASPSRVGAFFDMDKTLIAENSGSLYLRHRYEAGEIGGVAIVRGLVAYLQYKMGLLDVRAFTRELSADFAGQEEGALLAEAQHFVDSRVVPALYPEALERIVWHQERGHVLAIVSGATRFVVEPLARAVGIPSALYTRLEVQAGVLTGRVIDPVCFEEGKIFWIRRFVEERGIDLARSWFYSDSITDLPLLDLVGHPVVVNPDLLLSRKARQRHWPVRLFQAP